MPDIKVQYSKENDNPIYLSFKQWQTIKKIIDNEFDNESGSYSEVRIFMYDKELSIEGHCLMKRKRK